MADKRTSVIPLGRIERTIYLIRGEKVMLDFDLAKLYGIETSYLKRQVRRNSDRFPRDFMIELTKKEFENLRCQIGASRLWGGTRYPPFAFTEQGVAMLSSVLRSQRAVHVNIQIMRAFVHLRELMMAHKDLARKLEELERKYDKRFKVVFEVIQQLMEPPEEGDGERIGFHRG
ncbi:MAG: ORF6N domain-containing protein [Planctomycetota bacterium]|jgi:hypothetical protein